MEPRQKHTLNKTNIVPSRKYSNSDDQDNGQGSRSRQKKHNPPKQNHIQNQDSDIDMFADEQPQLAPAVPTSAPQPQSEQSTASTQVKTDETGYYIPILGTTINNGRFRVVEKLGKGVFGNVVKAVDTHQDSATCAIKILRKNELTQASGYREYKILSRMHEKHKLKRIMRVHNMFEEAGHLCIACELLATDLRTFGHKKQPTLADIRLYATGMMLISHQLRLSKVVHADIKPDNFMFRTLIDIGSAPNERVVVDNLRLVDFGTSFSVEEYNHNAEELVARYYRAPQIILGTQIKPSEVYGIDVWAMGCSLFELYTNQFLFTGSSNNDMLKQMQETKGKFSNKMLAKSVFRDKHFDDDYNFLWTYVDKVTKEHKMQKMQVTVTAQRDLMNMLKKWGHAAEPKELQSFRDFLERCLALNPKDRITPQEAIEHPFLHYQTKLEN